MHGRLAGDVITNRVGEVIPCCPYRGGSSGVACAARSMPRSLRLCPSAGAASWPVARQRWQSAPAQRRAPRSRPPARRPLSGRRSVAGGAAALAVGAGAARGATIPPARAQAPDKPQRIDVHHHFSPPKWIAEVKGRELLQPANTNWTPDKSIEDMD